MPSKIFGKKITNLFLFYSLRTVNDKAWEMIDNSIVKQVFFCSEDELVFEQETENPGEV
jgi:hypothetical protein